MADNEGGGGASHAAPPPRPTIALPPRTAYESLFRGSGVSPGPMTLVSSFFSEDLDAEGRFFSQLLAGAMASPVAAVSGRTLAAPPSAAEAREERSSSGGGVRSHRPLGVMVAPSSFFTVPPGLSPANLLESPSLFSPSPGPFGISHQQALAHVTAQAMQAAQANAQMHVRVDCHSDVSSVTLPASSALSSVPLEQTQTLTSDTNFIETTDDAQCKQRSQPAPLIVDKPADDGYNWRKYGQKQVKGSESSRSYYRCTHSNCPVKKKVQRSLNGQVTEIIYKGQHNHTQPPPNKRAKESSFPGGSTEVVDVPDSCETGSRVQVGNMNRPDEPMAVAQASRRDQESGLATAEQLSGSSDGEEVGDTEVRIEEGNDIEHDSKRSKMETRVIESNSSHRTLTEPRIIVQTTSEVDLLDDGYRWRKYGQKVVKGNPNPRSYYKCTNSGCNVRKHIERASTDPAAVITTYEGKHNHDVPAARNNSHAAANAGSATNVIQPRVVNLATNPALLKRIDFRSNDQQHVAVLQLKEEQEIT